MSALIHRRLERTSVRLSVPFTDVVPEEQARELQAMFSRGQEAQYLLCVTTDNGCGEPEVERQRPLYSTFIDKCKLGKLLGCGCGGRGAGNGALALFGVNVSIHLINHGGEFWLDVRASLTSRARVKRIFLRISTPGRKDGFVVPIYAATET